VKLRIIWDILLIGGFFILLLNFGELKPITRTKSEKTAFI